MDSSSLMILVGVNGAVDDAVDDADDVAEADDSDEADVSAGGFTGRNTGLPVLASIASLSRISRRAFSASMLSRGNSDVWSSVCVSSRTQFLAAS
jgi:hypothetical protein